MTDTVGYTIIAMIVGVLPVFFKEDNLINHSPAFYVTYIPTPVVLLTEVDGSQNVYIAPEAFKVASAEFGDEIEFWQNALPGKLKGQLSSVSILLEFNKRRSSQSYRKFSCLELESCVSTAKIHS